MNDSRTNKITRVNIFSDNDVWCYAAWCDDEYDHGDPLNATTESEARDEVRAMFPTVQVRTIVCNH